MQKVIKKTSPASPRIPPATPPITGATRALLVLGRVAEVVDAAEDAVTETM
jgi:hypothetical protein